jgi:fatty acid desaturase
MILTELLDHYVSPKIVAGPYASVASEPMRATLTRDRDYQELRTRLARTGFFAPARWSYAWRMIVIVALYAALFAYLASGPSIALRIAAALALGGVHTLCNFMGHDIAHGAVSKRSSVTEIFGQLFDTLLTGFSFTYFRRSHTLHHYHCNEDGFDPDTMSALWSVTEHGARNKDGLGRAMTRAQHVIVPFLYPFWGATLKVSGIGYALRNPREAWPDLVLLAVHYTGWFLLGGSLLDYVIMTLVVGVYLGIIFPIGHVGTASLSPAHTTSFLHQQLATTRNVTSSPLRDNLFMGLNSQIEHHLFPYGPSMRLGRARPVVRQFCAERGLPYEESGHRAAMVSVMRHLRRMAKLPKTLE